MLVRIQFSKMFLSSSFIVLGFPLATVVISYLSIVLHRPESWHKKTSALGESSRNHCRANFFEKILSREHPFQKKKFSRLIMEFSRGVSENSHALRWQTFFRTGLSGLLSRGIFFLLRVKQFDISFTSVLNFL